MQKWVSVIGHVSAGGMSRKTYSKNGTGLEKMRGRLEPREGTEKRWRRESKRKRVVNRKNKKRRID